jgi:hypothetical protein
MFFKSFDFGHSEYGLLDAILILIFFAEKAAAVGQAAARRAADEAAENEAVIATQNAEAGGADTAAQLARVLWDTAAAAEVLTKATVAAEPGASSPFKCVKPYTRCAACRPQPYHEVRVLNLVDRLLNLVPGTQYPVRYRKNHIENFPHRKSHPRQKPP